MSTIPLAKMSDVNAEHTPGPWRVGAQNDALYVTAGREPAADNDHPWHDAPRVVVAKVFETTEGEYLPLHAMNNARLIAAAPDMLAALEAFADPNSWVVNGRFDPSSGNFDATSFARSVVLKATGCDTL